MWLIYGTTMVPPFDVAWRQEYPSRGRCNKKLNNESLSYRFWTKDSHSSYKIEAAPECRLFCLGSYPYPGSAFIELVIDLVILL